jgi:hypothetical protein
VHFRAGASAFADVADLFIGRFAESENRFLEIGFFFRLILIRNRTRNRIRGRTARRAVPT